MKKIVAMILCVVCVMSLAACSSKDGGTSGKSYTDITGTTFSCEQFSALCPEGWSNNPQTDNFADDENAVAPDKLGFYKVANLAENPFAAFSNASVSITHHDADYEIWDLRSMYTNVEDVSFEVNGVKWAGYVGDYSSYKNGVLYVDGSGEWEISLCLTDTDGDIKVTDADVQAILASLKAK